MKRRSAFIAGAFGAMVFVAGVTAAVTPMPHGAPHPPEVRPQATNSASGYPTPTLTPSSPVPPVPNGSTVPESMLNPAVTQEMISTTICVSGWTSTIRPPASYTSALKKRQLAASGAADQNPRDYEEDHWIPLEVGGNPTSPTNLWPELWPDAHKKDIVENDLHREVCDHQISLAAAQQQMYQDWGP